jgi:type IV secretory pathway VirB2 component (pilin)
MTRLLVCPSRPQLAFFVASAALFSALLVATPHLSLASFGGGMPWEGPLNSLLNSLQGPVARVIGAAAIIGLGVGLAFSEGGSMMRKALWVVLGLAIAFNATSWGLGFLGFSGGVLV